MTSLTTSVSGSHDAIRFSDLVSAGVGIVVAQSAERVIRHFITDSRKAIVSDTSCFFAIGGERHDGHAFISELYHSGIRQFVVEKKLDWSQFPGVNVLLVESTLHALQTIASLHRKKFNIPVVGITGSNGKTIVKEWLYQLLSPDRSIVKSPGSYNSQLGVPLSVLQLHRHHQLALFEAGISRAGEMSSLQNVIRPTIGVFTNIGSSHDAGFKSTTEKINEKLKLFQSCEVLIYCADHALIHQQAVKSRAKLLAWGESGNARIPVADNGDGTVRLTFNKTGYSFALPVSDAASTENTLHCIVLMLHLGVNAGVIQERINTLRSVPMRLEVKQGLHQSLIIDDSYNNDLAGLQISLDFLSGQQKKNKVLILSDILQSGISDPQLAEDIANAIGNTDISTFYGVGPVLHAHQKAFWKINQTFFYKTTADLIRNLDDKSIQSSVILVKGARSFRFEQIVRMLQRKVHGTVMEIDLSAMVHNLNYFKSRLSNGVKLMVMVKAFAYGSGSEEVANLLQYHRVDYLGVAYADEGVELRKNRITIPIMVMNPSEEGFATMLEHQLEPEIYSLGILRAFLRFIGQRSWRIHLKLDTGMHRLGFEEADLRETVTLLKQYPNVSIASVFSHLAGADEPTHDEFSRAQVATFLKQYDFICKELETKPLRHVLNSPGILRFREFQFDMVRLGIGLYGIDPTSEPGKELQPVATLKTVISQVRNVGQGETIGYGRHGKATTAMKLGTIAIGYADGFSRSFSRGKGVVLVNGHRAPIVGNVCMDMTMIDLSGIDAKEGDDVIIFGKGLAIGEIAQRIDTIPYEILTNTSERVKRVFHAESI
jgi:alanine racemase